jgi:hypothetical protein
VFTQMSVWWCLDMCTLMSCLVMVGYVHADVCCMVVVGYVHINIFCNDGWIISHQSVLLVVRYVNSNLCCVMMLR